MEIIEIIVSIVLSVIIAVCWGKVLPFILPAMSRKLDRKPFNCRPCSTFHLTWMLITFCAVAGESFTLFLAGIPTAFIVFFIIRYIDNKKITK